MDIRAAQPQDTPAIIEILKKSLGESLIPITENLWSWKHEQNPFGKSFVLLALENAELIGVRAFMRWRWQWNGKEFEAIRAVDTATHPDHQGKGIFKKLTLQQVELCKQQGVHFVFNTPNEQSMPGYLKMGWEKQGRMPLKLKITRPFSLAYSKFVKPTASINPLEDPTPLQLWSGDIFKLVDKPINVSPLQLSTAATPTYIKWRYADNPLYRYNYFTDHENYLLISRIKTHSFSRELRLVDFYVLNSARSGAIRSHMKKEVGKFCKQHKLHFIALSGQQYLTYQSLFGWMGMIPVRPIGPIVTLRNMNMDQQFPQMLETKSWNYSLGDMELF